MNSNLQMNLLVYTVVNEHGPAGIDYEFYLDLRQILKEVDVLTIIYN